MNEFMRHSRTARIYAFTLCVLVTPVIATGQVPVAWDASFNPGTIGPGSVSTLQFDISNLTSVAVRNLGFSNTLPAGVTIASPAASLNTCGGTLSATNGGSTISLTDGGIGALGSCSVSVDVTASAPGTYTNVTGDLTSDAGNSGSASADLTVAADRPGFSKSFSPSVVAFGGRTTLTLTVDNTLNTSPAPNLRFTDNLPDGLGIADPSIASTTCTGGNLSAPAGGTVISYAPNYFGDASVAAGAICSVTVEVIAMSTGVLGNTTGELTSDNGSGARSSGKAANTLTVPSNDLSLTKSFTNDPAYPGGTVTLEFTVRNLNRRSAAADIGFTDDLNGTLSGLTAIDTPLSSPCGPGSTLTGNSVLTLASGNLDPEASCTFEVLLQVPAAASGAFTNTTSEITANVDGEPVTGNPATDVLVVTPAPLLTKTYLDDPVGAGGTVELEFSITNTSTILAASSIFFEDVFPVELGTAASVPATGFCGAGAQATFLPVSDFAPAKLTVSSASLAASDSCTFSITLNVAVDAAEGIYPNTTSFITAVVGNETTTGPPASDELTIVSAPRLQKEFTDDPVAAGDTVTLVFTLSHSEIAPGDASGITFSDDLDAALSGLEATGLPLQDVCGQGSQLVGTSTVTFSGGVLAPGESCSFAVTLQVPAGAAPGTQTNTTSAVMASVLGVDTMSSPATADLRVAGLTLTQDFNDDPVMPGGTVTVRYTLDNASSTSSATDIQFLHNLNNVVSGLTATVLPGADPCGAGSSLTGTNLLIFQYGTLDPESSCSFDVTLQVPAAAAPDTYNSVTSTVVATFEGTPIIFDAASAELTIASDFLMLSKEFVNDPVAPGDPVTLRFTLSNQSATEAVTGIEFTDDLDAALAGLVSTSGALPDVCGTGSEISGVGQLSFTGGSLAAGANCEFDVVLAVPAEVPLGTVVINTTSTVAGVIGGLPVTGDPAMDELQIDSLTLSKSFNGPVFAGETVTLAFTIQNHSTSTSFGDLSFEDDLNAMMPGLTALGLPATNVCGEVSEIAGTTFLAFSGGSLLPEGSCTFSVELSVPGSADEGLYTNITTELGQFGLPLAAAATATLEVLVVQDEDNDGVLDPFDHCPGTAIPEGVPTVTLKTNRYALVDEDFIFDTKKPNGNGPGETFTTTDTGGCSCEQIIEEEGLGNGHTKFGCSLGAMRNWIEAIESHIGRMQRHETQQNMTPRKVSIQRN